MYLNMNILKFNVNELVFDKLTNLENFKFDSFSVENPFDNNSKSTGKSKYKKDAKASQSSLKYRDMNFQLYKKITIIHVVKSQEEPKTDLSKFMNVLKMFPNLTKVTFNNKIPNDSTFVYALRLSQTYSVDFSESHSFSKLYTEISGNLVA